jgi:hypothetical protein
MNSARTLKDSLKLIGDSKSRILLNDLFLLQELSYQGLEYIQNDTDISSTIEALKELEIIDYDEFSGIISLEYQTENYFKFLTNTLNSLNDVGIDEIEQKINSIKSNLRDIGIRNEDSKKQENREISDFTTLKESKDIQKTLRAFPSIIKKNFIIISEVGLYYYKTEQNIEVKIKRLEECRMQLNELSKALDKIQNFLNKEDAILSKILTNKKLLDFLRQNIIDNRKTFIFTREEITTYLNKTLEDGKFLKKLSKLSLILRENQILHKTNIVDVVTSSKNITSKYKYQKKIDFALTNYIEELEKRIKAKKLNIEIVSEVQKLPSFPINKNKNGIEKEIVNVEKLYREYSKNYETNLIDFLYEKGLSVKKINYLFVVIVNKWFRNLTINKNKVVQKDNYIYPVVMNKA